MTKTFEKDLNEKLNSEKVPMYITQKGCSLTRKTFIETNWLFANYGNYHSDEEFQEILDKYSNLNDNYEKEVIRRSNLETSNLKLIAEGNGLLSDNATLTKEVADLKFQLQQQALPVVPKDVTKWIEDLKSKGYGPLKNPGTYGDAISDLSDESLEKILTWISQHQEEFMRAWLDGYTVEKPQLFYLKNKLTGAYLYYDEATKLYSDIVGNVEDFFGTKTKFTQQEIDSMETGSYEKIEVTE